VISPASNLHNAGSETGSVSVTTAGGCVAGRVSIPTTWVTIKAGATGTNNGIVKYTVGANPNPSVRSGGHDRGAANPIPCPKWDSVHLFDLDDQSRPRFGGGHRQCERLHGGRGVPGTVVNTNTWITLTSGTTGLGNGIVTYAVAANLSPTDSFRPS